jgi:hypothetical protein
VIHKIADAFMVAGVVGTVVELSSLNRLIEYVGRDVARRVSAAHLPPALRSQIWTVVNSQLVYEDYQRGYRLTRGVSGRMNVESTITYKVRNYGFTSVPYSPMLGEESFHKPKFLSVEYRLTSGGGHAFSEEELVAFTAPRPRTRALRVDSLPKVMLRPKDQMPEEVCTVVWRYVAEMEVDYSDITAFGGATIKPVIQLDDKPDDIDFFSDGEGIEHIEGGRRWVFNRPFIEGQHVRVWWHRAGRQSSGTET